MLYAKLRRDVYVALGVQFLGMTSWAERVFFVVRVVSLTENGPTNGPGVRLQVAPHMCFMSCHCAEFVCAYITIMQISDFTSDQYNKIDLKLQHDKKMQIRPETKVFSYLRCQNTNLLQIS